MYKHKYLRTKPIRAYCPSAALRTESYSRKWPRVNPTGFLKPQLNLQSQSDNKPLGLVATGCSTSRSKRVRWVCDQVHLPRYCGWTLKVARLMCFDKENFQRQLMWAHGLADGLLMGAQHFLMSQTALLKALLALTRKKAKHSVFEPSYPCTSSGWSKAVSGLVVISDSSWQQPLFYLCLANSFQ